MSFTITSADFGSTALRDFLQAHLDDMEPTAPPESRHALDLEGLQRPGVRVWTAIDGDAVIGTAALAPIEDGWEELKSMRTAPERRGEGIAARLLVHVLVDAQDRDVQRVSLETGSQEFFAPARRLYAQAGFAECEPFASYLPDPNSVFMTRPLGD
ncbi:GNAT family N-acetyltransferase [Leifsonia sp. NPDC058194]|uniref:GNAT family N-acetyltransferase n=1 Tax=Leifsonia sp. NPDC058194 TaxID=3346374 RepID=UPI0036DBC22C